MTLYQFNENVPASNDNPSVDQGPMLTNNQSTLGILSEDHVTFNLNNGGQHTAITFNQDASYVPGSFPVDPPELFTNTVDGFGNALAGGVAGLFYYSGSNAQSQVNYLSQNNGSTLLFGGVIMKWATANVPAGFTNTITFPSAFPNACWAVVVTIYNSSVAPDTAVLTVQANNYTPANFLLTTSSTSRILTISYIAIGN